MALDRGLLGRIKTRGGEVLTQLSAELMANPRLAQALEGAWRGREKLEQAAARALGRMQVATQGELRRAGSRIEALEREVAELRRQLRARPSRARAAKLEPAAAVAPARRDTQRRPAGKARRRSR